MLRMIHLPDRDRLMDLCAFAAKEHDSDKLLARSVAESGPPIR
jgi:hypothetical protein